MIPQSSPAWVVGYRPAAKCVDYASAGSCVGPCAIVTADGRQRPGRMWDWPSTPSSRAPHVGQNAANPDCPAVETQLLLTVRRGTATFRWNKNRPMRNSSPPGAQAVCSPRPIPARRAGGVKSAGVSWSRKRPLSSMLGGDTLSFNWVQPGRPTCSSPFISQGAAASHPGIGAPRQSRHPSGQNPPLRPTDTPWSITDASEPLDQRAHAPGCVNCAGCHRYSGGGAYRCS